MWELDYKESWVPKNWCLLTVVLEKTLESPLDCKEIQPVHSEGDKPWDFFGRNDAKAETPVLWPPDAKNWLIKTQMCIMDFWTLRERERVGWFGRMALKNVYYHVRNESPVYVRYRIQDAWGWCTGMIQRDDMGWEVGGGFRIGNSCTPVADSCQCMAKPIQCCKIK